MKNYLTKKVWLLYALMLILPACGGSSKKAAGEESAADSAATSIPGIETMLLNNVKVTWIQDNAEERLMPRTLFADAPDSIIDRLNLQDGIPSSVSTFLVETEGIRILFDTGLGAPDSRLTESLKSLGIAPADIKYLYLTHFHGDHIGGMMKGDSIVFPNAEVYASKTEYEAWMKMPEKQRAQVVKTMESYRKQLHLFEFGDTLPGRITALGAVGHTPGHTVFQTEKLLVIGDLMHGAALQAAYPEFSAAYDHDKEKAAETRKRFLKYAKDNGLTLAGMHLPAPAFMAAGQY